MVASSACHLHIVKLLLKKGANVNEYKNERGLTPLILATMKMKVDSLKAETRGAFFDEFSEKPLMQEVEFDTVDMFDINTSFYHEKGVRERLEVIRLLLAYGADVSIKDKKGWTALDYAKEEGASELIELLENG